jgi:hypothetical protein
MISYEVTCDDLTFPEVDKRTDIILALAKKFTPVVTGRLKAGWKKVIKATCPYGNPQKTIIIENRVPYAHFVEYGTRLMKGPPAAMLGKAIFFAEVM